MADPSTSLTEWAMGLLGLGGGGGVLGWALRSNSRVNGRVTQLETKVGDRIAVVEKDQGVQEQRLDANDSRIGKAEGQIFDTHTAVTRVEAVLGRMDKESSERHQTLTLTLSEIQEVIRSCRGERL